MSPHSEPAQLPFRVEARIAKLEEECANWHALYDLQFQASIDLMKSWRDLYAQKAEVELRLSFAHSDLAVIRQQLSAANAVCERLVKERDEHERGRRDIPEL